MSLPGAPSVLRSDKDAARDALARGCREGRPGAFRLGPQATRSWHLKIMLRSKLRPRIRAVSSSSSM